MARRIEIPGAEGQTLSARLDGPPGKPRAWALFAHCFSCSKDVLAAQRIAGRLAELGYGVLRFDFTGLGHSEGEFADTNFSTNLDDLEAAAAWLARTHGGPDLLIGHSLGGAAAVAVAARLTMVKAVAAIGAPSDAEHVIHNFGDKIDEIEARGEAEVDLAGRPFKIKRQFLEDVRGARVRDAARDLRRPLLVMHAPRDSVVGIDNATNLFLAAKHPKSFVSLDDADHLLTRPKDAVFVADVIAAWADRYVAPAAVSPPAASSVKSVRVEETGEGRFTNSAQVGRHSLIADEPPSAGGGDRGPDPYDFLSIGLGACTNMTLRMYADRKKWPLAKVSTEIVHVKDYAADCEHCEDGRKVDVFERRIRIEGDLTAEQRARLIEIADRCPVHRTLHDNVHIRTAAV